MAYIPPQPHAKLQAARDARARVRTPVGVAVKIERHRACRGRDRRTQAPRLGRARSRGTRKLQLQLLAAATAINLKRLLAQDAYDNRSDADHQRQPATTAIRLLIAVRMLVLLTATLDEISRLATADTSTAS